MSIPAEPVVFIDTIIELMIKHKQLYEGFKLPMEVKMAFGRDLANWIKIDMGEQTGQTELTEDQKLEAVRLTKSFIEGYYWGRKYSK